MNILLERWDLTVSYDTRTRTYYITKRRIEAEPGSPEELLQLFADPRPQLAFSEEFLAQCDFTHVNDLLYRHFGPIARGGQLVKWLS